MNPTDLTLHFFHLHQAPLRLPNCWDALSARLFEQAGAPALATSSAALAWSLGFADGGELPQRELLQAVERMRRVTTLPLSIDIEDGYSHDPQQVADLAEALCARGVNGVNLEDGLAAPELLMAKIAAIRARLDVKSLFINARTDLALRQLVAPQALQDAAVQRGLQYLEAGADGLFLPGCLDAAVVRGVAAAVPLPLNLMLLPGDPREADLVAAGARRLSCGPGLLLQALGGVMQAGRPWMGGADATWDYSAINALF